MFKEYNTTSLNFYNYWYNNSENNVMVTEPWSLDVVCGKDSVEQNSFVWAVKRELICFWAPKSLNGCTLRTCKSGTIIKLTKAKSQRYIIFKHPFTLLITDKAFPPTIIKHGIERPACNPTKWQRTVLAKEEFRRVHA
jgi:hypothetical protein